LFSFFFSSNKVRQVTGEGFRGGSLSGSFPFLTNSLPAPEMRGQKTRKNQFPGKMWRIMEAGQGCTTEEVAMADPDSFADLVRRLRGGDEQAAEQLVRQYEAAIRLEVRCRLGDPRLRRVFDSMDVCQAVLGSFFVRAAAGQFELDRPEQLLQLLKGMARKKVAFQARMQRAGRRDVRRIEGAVQDGWDGIGAEATPSRVVAGKDLLAEVRRRLSEEERDLADRRGQGREWADIAAELGGTPGGRRKQLTRALDRVALELGLDEGS
jgi:RNA polymerase sigma-70 factor (ECF subfamily)